MAIKWTTTDKAHTDRGLKAMVYGAAGVGKTVLCTTAPRPLIISAEGGTLSARHVSVPVAEVATLDDIRSVLNDLKTKPQVRDSFDTVCLDSLSEIGEVVLASAKARAGDPRQAYGKLIEELIPLVKEFRDLPHKHVLVTVKEATTTNQMTGAVSKHPSMPGQTVQHELPYLFDFVFHLDIGATAEGKKFRYLRTQPTDQGTIAKDRSGVLAEVEAPNFSAVVAKVLAA